MALCVIITGAGHEVTQRMRQPVLRPRKNGGAGVSSGRACRMSTGTVAEVAGRNRSRK